MFTWDAVQQLVADHRRALMAAADNDRTIHRHEASPTRIWLASTTSGHGRLAGSRNEPGRLATLHRP